MRLRLANLEPTFNLLEQLGDDFKKDVFKMVDCSKKIIDNFSKSETFSDEEFLETAGFLDRMKNLLVLAISKTSEEGPVYVGKKEPSTEKPGNMLKILIRQKFESILHYSQLEVEEANKLMGDLTKSSDDASKLKTSLGNLSSSSPDALTNLSLDLRRLEDELEMMDFKLSEVYSILAQWEKELDGKIKVSQSNSSNSHQQVPLAEKVSDHSSDGRSKAEEVKETEPGTEEKSEDDESHVSPLPGVSRQEVQSPTMRGDSREGTVPSISARQSGTSSRIETYMSLSREKILSKLVTEMGEISKCLTAGQLENVWYEGGTPDKFWLRVQTPALDKMNKIIEVTPISH